MLKYSLTAVLLGGLSALLYLSVIVTPGGVIMASFTQAPLFIAGLSLGLPAALMATAVASVSVMTAGGLLGGIVHALVNALPVLICLIEPCCPAGRQTAVSNGIRQAFSLRGSAGWRPLR
jgi:hypothetical protein